MRKNRIRELWREGKPATVGWIGTASPYATEVMANAGFDGLVVDMQHGMAITPDMAATCLQVISTTDTLPMARVPWNRPEWVQYVLDAGAMGVIIPMINNYEEAVVGAGACRYPPLGYRSVGPNRSVLYSGADYIEKSNDETICLLMIETKEGIDNLEEIAQTPGIDGFYIGPADLAVSLGVPMAEWPTNEKHQRACQKVLDVANGAGLVAAHHSTGGAHAAEVFRQGFKLANLGSDSRFVASAAADALKAMADAM